MLYVTMRDLPAIGAWGNMRRQMHSASIHPGQAKKNPALLQRFCSAPAGDQVPAGQDPQEFLASRCRERFSYRQRTHRMMSPVGPEADVVWAGRDVGFQGESRHAED